MVQQEEMERVKARAAEVAEERLLDLLLPHPPLSSRSEEQGMLDDLGHSVTFDQRGPVDKAKQQASDIRDDLLKALFGEQNAPSHKG